MNSRPGAPALGDPALHVAPVPPLCGPAMNAVDQALEAIVERVVRRVVKIGRAVRVRRDAQLGEPVIGADVPGGSSSSDPGGSAIWTRGDSGDAR